MVLKTISKNRNTNPTDRIINTTISYPFKHNFLFLNKALSWFKKSKNVKSPQYNLFQFIIGFLLFFIRSGCQIHRRNPNHFHWFFLNKFIFLCIGMILVLPAYSQKAVGIVSDSTQLKTIKFNQEYYSYQWQVLFKHQWAIQPRFRISVNESFTSSLLNLGGQNRKWKDNQILNTQFDYLLLPDVVLKSIFSSVLFVDGQSGFSNDLNIHSLLFGFDYRPKQLKKASYFLLSPVIGIKTDKRFDFLDIGPNYNLDFQLTDYKLAEYQNNLFMHFNYDFLKNRRNEDATIHYRIHRKFYEETADTLSFLIDQKYRDYYLSSKGDVENFDEKSYIFQNKLWYHLQDGIGLNWVNEINNREVKITSPDTSRAAKDTRRRADFRVENQLNFLAKKNWYAGFFKILYWSQEQVFQSSAASQSLPAFYRITFIAPDNKSRFLSTELAVGARFLKSDSISFGTSLSRLQYDTPDTSNFDDRDEFRCDLKLSAFHRFSPTLRMRIDAVVNLHHLVFIFGERSADNNWNRIFRLSPVIDYSFRSRIFFQQTFEVLANYVDYDYEFETGDVKSFIYRKFQSRSLLDYQITRATKIGFSYRLEYEENGKLFWERWKEQPLLLRQNNWIRMTLAYFPRPSIRIVPGLNFFQRTEWKYFFSRDGKLMQEKFQDFLSFGPLFNFIYEPHSRLKFVCSLSRDQIQRTRQKKYYITNIDVELNWNF